MLKIFDFDGSAYERGHAQGEALRETWLSMEQDFFNSEILKSAKPAFIPNFIVRMALSSWGNNRTRHAVKQHLPSIYERVKGIGDGLGIPRRYAWGLQYAELLFCLAGNSLAIPNTGCTQAHATPKATADGKPLSSRNYDFPNMLLPYQIIRREIPSEPGRLATMNATQVPTAGSHQGINEAGLTIGANNNRAWIPADYNTRGIPSLMLLQEALETCRTVSEAAAFITNFPARGNAGFFGIMDASGDCCVVEFTASRFSIRKPDDSGVIAQANHFINMKEANIPDGTYWRIKGMEDVEYSASTKARYASADQLLHEHAGKITVETLKTILGNHNANDGTGNDMTVCCHGEAGSTLSSFVIDINERTMWVAESTPCRNPYKEIKFRNRS